MSCPRALWCPAQLSAPHFLCSALQVTWSLSSPGEPCGQWGDAMGGSFVILPPTTCYLLFPFSDPALHRWVSARPEDFC